MPSFTIKYRQTPTACTLELVEEQVNFVGYDGEDAVIVNVQDPRLRRAVGSGVYGIRTRYPVAG